MGTIALNRPTIFQWQPDGWIDWTEEINPDNIIECADWIKRFSGVNKLHNDVSKPLERCVIGAYQIGYLFDYMYCEDDEQRSVYFEEGIASILLHTIATYEMMDREYIHCCDTFRHYNYQWNCWLFNGISTEEDNSYNPLRGISENMFKFQRWVLYHHMGRTQRWDEIQFGKSIESLTIDCMLLAKNKNCDLARGFALCMEKLQDQEIRRH